MSDYQRIEKEAAGREARAAVGSYPRGSRAGDIDAALMRYLAAEEYHEKVEETQAAGHDGDEDTTR